MSLPLRAATIAAIAALVSASAVGAAIYGSLSGEGARSVTVSALALGFVSSATAFLAVWVVARGRHPARRPVIGFGRGAAIGAGVLLFVSACHAVLNAGAAGILASLIGQVFFSFLFFGWFAAVIGGIFGKYVERKVFSVLDT
jgi:hypothetical protein